jgi:hypothetical protein
VTKPHESGKTCPDHRFWPYAVRMLPRWFNPYKREMRRMRHEIWWESSIIPGIIVAAVILLTIAGLMNRN